MKQTTNLYRFSPIKNKEELFEAINHIHFTCNKLCRQSLGEYLPNRGIVGVFCHYGDEYEKLVKIQEQLVDKSESVNEKYFKLLSPITIPTKDGVSETVYRYLYIRKPDPYRHHVGDADFYLDDEKYKKLKQSLLNGKVIKGVRVYYKPESNMIELYDPDIDSLSYVYTRKDHSV